MSTDELRAEILRLLDQLPEWRVEQLYGVLMHIPHLEKMSNGGVLTEEESEEIDVYLRNALVA